MKRAKPASTTLVSNNKVQKAKSRLFLDTMPCSPIKSNQHFRRNIFNGLHDAVPQHLGLFITSAVESSNPALQTRSSSFYIFLRLYNISLLLDINICLLSNGVFQTRYSQLCTYWVLQSLHSRERAGKQPEKQQQSNYPDLRNSSVPAQRRVTRTSRISFSKHALKILWW